MTATHVNPFILNYDDAVIYQSDLDILLQDREWLNDAIINFQFKILSNNHKNSKFMDPAVINFFMHQCVDDDDIQDFASSFHATSAASGKTFVPINDSLANSSDWQNVGAGSHWSLLLIQILDINSKNINNNHSKNNDSNNISYWHFDSSSGSSNTKAAQMVANKFHHHIFQSKHSSAKLIQAKTPQQNNSYDCGLHTLAAAQLIAETPPLSSLQQHENQLESLFRENPLYCKDLRKRIAQSIQSLRNA